MGMRWSADIPLVNILTIDDVQGEWKNRKDAIKLAILDDPKFIMTLREPVVMQGIAGITREVRAIAMLPDDDDLVSVLRMSCAVS
jgi:hypothetical protein